MQRVSNATATPGGWTSTGVTLAGSAVVNVNDSTADVNVGDYVSISAGFADKGRIRVEWKTEFTLTLEVVASTSGNCSLSTVAGMYTDGVPSTVSPTVINSKYINLLQEEIANVVEYAGLTLDVGNKKQLKTAIETLTLKLGGAIVGNLAITGNLSMTGNLSLGGILDSYFQHNHVNTESPLTATPVRKTAFGLSGNIVGGTPMLLRNMTIAVDGVVRFNMCGRLTESGLYVPLKCIGSVVLLSLYTYAGLGISRTPANINEGNALYITNLPNADDNKLYLVINSSGQLYLYYDSTLTSAIQLMVELDQMVV